MTDETPPREEEKRLETYEITFIELDEEKGLAIHHRHIVTSEYLPRQEYALAKGLIPVPRGNITAYTFAIYVGERPKPESEMSTNDKLIRMVNQAREDIKKKGESGCPWANSE